MTIEDDRQISRFVPDRLPEFVRVDHPTLVSFLEAYYEWLGQRRDSGFVLSPMAMHDIPDVDTTLDQFIDQFKRQYLFNFPESLAVNEDTGEPVDLRRLVKNIKQFYLAKGTEKSYEFLFRIFYDTNVEFYYPKKDILRLSSGRWIKNNYLRISNALGDQIYRAAGNLIIQRNSRGEIVATAKVVSVNIFQIDNFSVAELLLSSQNGTFQTGELGIEFEDGAETFKEVRVYSVVSTVNILDGGSNYRIGERIRFVSSTKDGGQGGMGTIAEVDAAGGIRKINIDDFGINYTDQPTIVVETSRGTGFSGNVVVGSLCQSFGYYANNDGRLSTNKVLQDNHYYQNWSYVLKSEIVIDTYRELIRRLVHPVGVGMFGSVLIKRCNRANLENASALMRVKIPYIGNYTPYTFQTFDDLSLWFQDSEGEGVTSAGYAPDYHDEYIQAKGDRIAVIGNPISNNVAFKVATSGVLATEGFPTGDPFWIIYPHANKEVDRGYHYARIWQSQVNDFLGWHEWIQNQNRSIQQPTPTLPLLGGDGGIAAANCETLVAAGCRALFIAGGCCTSPVETNTLCASPCECDNGQFVGESCVCCPCCIRIVTNSGWRCVQDPSCLPESTCGNWSDWSDCFSDGGPPGGCQCPNNECCPDGSCPRTCPGGGRVCGRCPEECPEACPNSCCPDGSCPDCPFEGGLACRCANGQCPDPQTGCNDEGKCASCPETCCADGTCPNCILDGVLVCKCPDGNCPPCDVNPCDDPVYAIANCCECYGQGGGPPGGEVCCDDSCPDAICCIDDPCSELCLNYCLENPNSIVCQRRCIENPCCTGCNERFCIPTCPDFDPCLTTCDGFDYCVTAGENWPPSAILKRSQNCPEYGPCYPGCYDTCTAVECSGYAPCEVECNPDPCGITCPDDCLCGNPCNPLCEGFDWCICDPDGATCCSRYPCKPECNPDTCTPGGTCYDSCDTTCPGFDPCSKGCTGYGPCHPDCPEVPGDITRRPCNPQCPGFDRCLTSCPNYDREFCCQGCNCGNGGGIGDPVYRDIRNRIRRDLIDNPPYRRNDNNPCNGDLTNCLLGILNYDPYENIGALLKYDETSEFRKITLRAFFNMPSGDAFDCREENISQVQLPSFLIRQPINGQEIKTEDPNRPLTVQYTILNKENVGYYKIAQINVYIDNRLRSTVSINTQQVSFANVNNGRRTLKMEMIDFEGKKVAGTEVVAIFGYQYTPPANRGRSFAS